MAFLEFGGKRTTVPAGEMLIGSGAECHLRLESQGIAQRAAVLTTAPDQSVAVRKLDAAASVEVNGVSLGPLPQPLLHGDKLTIGGRDLLFVDERKSGSTQYVSAVKLQDLAPSAKSAAPGKATAGTGGRIVSLVDGREYQVGTSVKFGRDASADIVVASSQVSRRHAEIVASPRGYILVDSSTNGTFVNGERVQNQRLLARADVIKIGDEEFRFYADVAAAPAPAPAPAAPAAPAPAVAAPAAPAAPAAAAPPPPPVRPVPVAPAPPLAAAASAAPEAAAVRTLPPPPPTPPPPPDAHASAQLISTGYFPSPPRGVSSVQPPAAPAPPAPPPPAAPQAAAAPAPPAPPAAKPPQALAKFLVRSGSLKGQRLFVKVPIVNIGRADYNDLVIPDDSVSSQHAKLTRREGVWILADLGSTNGTMVDGEKVDGDVPIAPGAFIRFGDVQLVFEPTDDNAGMQKGGSTRMISAADLKNLRPPSGR